MVIRIIDVLFLFGLFVLSNIIFAFLGAYIAYRCKENKEILPLSTLSILPENGASSLNNARFQKNKIEGVSVI